MSSLDGQDVFGSGPHTISQDSWLRSVEHRGFAGADGELLLDMGLRSRALIQKGRLQASSVVELQSLLSQVENLLDGRTHELVDNHGTSYERVVVEHFALTTPIQRGRGFWCDYTVRYRQLP